jgi:hypothetical protein
LPIRAKWNFDPPSQPGAKTGADQIDLPRIAWHGKFELCDVCGAEGRQHVIFNRVALAADEEGFASRQLDGKKLEAVQSQRHQNKTNGW